MTTTIFKRQILINATIEYEEIGPSIVRRFALLGGPGGS